MNTAPKLHALMVECQRRAKVNNYSYVNLSEAYEWMAKELQAIAALAPPSGEGVARAVLALRDALSYVGQRSDGDLATIAERAELWMRESKTLLNTPQSSPVDGEFVLVPREPTPQMIDATWDHKIDRDGSIESQNTRNRRIYTAMIAAAPTPPPASQEGEGDFPVMRSAFVTSESCGPDGDYRLVFRFRSLEALQQAHHEWVTTPQPATADGSDLTSKEEWENLRAYFSTSQPPASQERGGDRPFDFVVTNRGDYWTVQTMCGPEPRNYIIRKADGALFELPDDRVLFVVFPSPPSSAAEASINSHEIDSKLIPDAAEQAKPERLESESGGLESAEQAQAGELWDATELANGLSNWAHIVDNETSRLLLQRSAALLRRLAGGVTDEMVERAAFTWRYYTGSTENNARMRAALVAALGAK